MKRILAVVAVLLSFAIQAAPQGPTASLDPAFGRGGVVHTNLGAAISGMAGVRGMALQADGKIVVIGLGLLQLGNAPLLARFNTDGTLDSSFNSTGYATANPAGITSPSALAIQADGKIVVAGSGGQGPRFAVARFNSNGSVDTSFGGTGGITTAGTGNARAVAIQADGRIVVAGDALVRYNADGSLDTTFGGGGIVAPPFSANALALQADARIVVGGSASTDFALARYNTNGTPDATFNGSGTVTTSFGPTTDTVFSLAIAPDGKIVAAGQNGGPTCCLDGPSFGIARYNTDGTLDTTFNGTGLASLRFGRRSSLATSVAVFPDGGVVVAGYSYDDPGMHIAMARLTPAGGGDGFALAPRDPYGYLGTETLSAVAVQPDGKIVAAGSTGPMSAYLLLRVSATGTADTSFGQAGFATMPSSLRADVANAVAILPDGKIVAAGATDDLATADPITLARYGTDGRVDTIFGGGRSTHSPSGNPLSSAHAYALAIEGDGNLMVAGDVVTTGFNTGSFPTSNFVVARIGTSGPSQPGFAVASAQTTLENYSTARAIRIQPDGRIVAAGFTATNASFQPPGTKRVAVVRYNTDLSLDTGFGGGTGKVVTVLGTGDAQANAVAVRADGSIVAAGSARNAGNQDWAFVVYSAAGAPSGSLMIDVSAGSDDAINAMVVQPDGAILVGGAAGNQAALARFTIPGLFDTSFANGGRFLTPGAPIVSMALQADGKIVAVTRDFQVWRFLSTGMPDWTFGIGGRFALTMGAGSSANAVAVRADGRIVVAGNADGGFGQDFVVARIDPGPGPSLVTHYYQSILRRAPDAGGKSFWDGEAVRVTGLGANVNEAWFALAQTFFTSGEYAAFNRDNTGFVTDLFVTFFDRAPDSGGLAYWKGQLDSGLPREVLLAQFMFSPEFTAFTQAIFGNPAVRAEVDAVMDFYRGLLGRLPDSAGFNYWVGRFRTAQCQGQAAIVAEVEAISSAFTLSGEYASRGRTHAQYVGDLYNAFLRRGGDLGGVQYWIGQLDTAARTREQVRVEFRNSAEFQARVNAIVQQGCLQ